VESLAHHDCLQLSPRGQQSFGGLRAPPLTGSLTADNVVLLRRALVAGIGIAALPHSVAAADLVEGRLQIVLPEVPCAQMGVWLLCAHRRHQPARVRVFADFLAEQLVAPDWMLPGGAGESLPGALPV
jgi:DNA-binding transcriptional LysR family regulator